MIEIRETDLPITVAQKLITATSEIPNENCIEKAVNAMCGGDGTRYAFTEDELMEIAAHLICYCKYAEQTKEQK